MTVELVYQCRPKTLSEVIGQPQAVHILESKLASKSLPHVIMLIGPTGCGKSTLAHITIAELKCQLHHLTKINCADDRGMDMVREIAENSPVRPLGGSVKVWLLEEVVQLPKATQQAFLDLMENLPSWVYFILCTTTTDGLLPTFKDRCFQIHLDRLDDTHIRQILQRGIKRLPILRADDPPKLLPSDRVFDTIIQRSSGSARKALYMLEAVLALDDTKAQLAAIGSVEAQETIEFLAKVLVRRATWPEVAKAIGAIQEKDVETIRRQVLAYMGKVLLGRLIPGNPAFAIAKAFEYSWKDSGKDGLTTACYGLCQNWLKK